MLIIIIYAKYNYNFYKFYKLILILFQLKENY